MNRQQAMPAVVQCIAVVSSSRAAGYQDFCNELAKSPYRFCLTLFDAVVQGAAAEDSIVDALSRIAAAGEAFDAVVMIRGGGSSSDLNCFNAYRLCNHVAQFPLPVVTGIGHDKDTSVADLVAHTALKTPTAVAAWLVERMAQADGYLAWAGLQLGNAALAITHSAAVGLEQARRGSRTAEPAVVAGGAEPPRPGGGDAARGSGRSAARARPPARGRFGAAAELLGRTGAAARVRRRPPRRRSVAQRRGELAPGDRLDITLADGEVQAAVVACTKKNDRTMDKKELTYDEAMAEIEAILAKFRNEEMSVDALAAEVRRATTLIAFCRKRLFEGRVRREKDHRRMKRLIRWALNHVPRPLLQRLAGWAVPVAGLFYVGRGRECPVCGARRRRFLPYGYVAPRADALCPSCLSLERHRLLWLYLTRETDLLRRPQRILHIAPKSA